MSLPTLNQPTQTLANSRWHGPAFLFCAMAAVVLYIALPKNMASLPLAEPSYAGEVFPWVKNLTKSSLVALQESGSLPAASVWFLGICAGLFAIFGVMLKLVSGIQSARLQTFLFGAGAVFLLVHLLSPLMLSSDVFAYALYGRVAAIYHANPYDAAPPVAPGDPFLKLFGQEYLPSWYGPLWTLISAGLTKLSGEHVGLTVLLFRVTAVLAALVCAVLIWASLRRFAPERAAQGLVFFLWNPLLVVETGLSGHNDSVMLALVLLGVWLHLRGWKTGAVVALTLSALVKFLTGMLIPLYVWMVLRQAATRRERIGFLARSVLAASVVCAAAMLFTRSNSDVPVQHQAIAPDFYMNNFHELIFKGIRRALGEDAESVCAPIYFQGWWIATTANTTLHASDSAGSEPREPIAAGTSLLVVAPQGNDWARVYNPATGHFGYVNSTECNEIPRPTLTVTDPVLEKFEKMATDWPTVRQANNIIRTVTWFLFAAFSVLCAWRTRSFEDFLVWSAAMLLASYFLIITEIWPWYVNWAVAVAALVTHRAPARLAALLSAGVMTLDVTLGFVGSQPAWVAVYRSVLAFVLPLLIWLLLYSRRAKNHATS